LALLLEQRVHLVVVHRLGELAADLIEAMDQRERVGDALLDGLPNGLLRIELRLLREVADLDARLRARLAVEILVDARHDPEQRGLAGAVQAQHADLRSGIETEADLAQDVPLRRNDLRKTVRGIDVLCHLIPVKKRRPAGWGLRLSANAA